MISCGRYWGTSGSKTGSMTSRVFDCLWRYSTTEFDGWNTLYKQSNRCSIGRSWCKSLQLCLKSPILHGSIVQAGQHSPAVDRDNQVRVKSRALVTASISILQPVFFLALPYRKTYIKSNLYPDLGYRPFCRQWLAVALADFYRWHSKSMLSLRWITLFTAAKTPLFRLWQMYQSCYN